ncbi:MAG TPA: SDR family oxidoreductase [Candidatus Bathyarchaeia archaeon]|nr:SDR family oxidoreductase [Candidatus Bathyarchaeia archaeon]
MSGILEGKAAIVTGGGSGLGRAGARALARAGARVAIADLNLEQADSVAAEVRGEGGVARAIACDAGDSASVQAMIAATVAAFGRLDVLYNNAGIAPIGEDGFVAAMADSAWDRVIRVNLTSVFLCSKYAIPHIASGGGGAIVNTASSMAHVPLGATDAYAASKAGVAGLTRSMAVGCSSLNIRVNAISPGYVDTPMNSMIFGSDELREAFATGHMSGLQTPEEIADLVVFLASDLARSLTGATINCDRGWCEFKMPDALSRVLRSRPEP